MNIDPKDNWPKGDYYCRCSITDKFFVGPKKADVCWSLLSEESKAEWIEKIKK